VSHRVDIMPVPTRGDRTMPAAIAPFPTPRGPWPLHEHPDRPLDGYTMICSCVTCRAVLVDRGRREPRSVMGIKTGYDRLLVTSDLLGELLVAETSLDMLVYVEDDYVRSLYVPVATRLPSRQRWWSLTCEEDDRAVSLAARRYRVPRRQSRARRDARAASYAITDARAGPAPDLVALPNAVRSARARHQHLIAAAAAWALGQGRPLQLDVLALILAATETNGREVSPLRWSRTGVNAVLSVHVFSWCSIHRTLNPDGVPETLWTYLDFLFATGRIDPASDPLCEVRKPLMCYAGLDEQGLPQRDAHAPRAPCECHVVYRGPSVGACHGVGG
jgi:hypothetical protein